MSAPSDFRTFILGSTAISDLVSTRVHYGRVPSSAENPKVWFTISEEDLITTMDGDASLHKATIDLECVALTASSAQSLGDAVAGRLHAYSGAMGATTCQACLVNSRSEKYVPFSDDENQGWFVVALGLSMFYTT